MTMNNNNKKQQVSLADVMMRDRDIRKEIEEIKNITAELILHVDCISRSIVNRLKSISDSLDELGYQPD